MHVKPDLLFVHPGTNNIVYEKLADTISAKEPPFIAALAAGFIRNNGYSVEILDAEVEGLNYAQTAEKVAEIDPGLTAIIVHGQQPSASSHLMQGVGDVCSEIKEISDNKIILTGIHPSALSQRTLEEEVCDYVARGEEFKTILGLLEEKDLKRIPGLGYFEGGEFKLNKAAPLISNLDEELGDIAWDLLPPMKNYRAHNWHANFADVEDRSPYASIYTSLGCPFKCGFCVINTSYLASIEDNKKESSLPEGDESRLKILEKTNPKMRTWNPEKVVNTIEYLVKEQGVKHLKIIDEMFVFHPNHYVSIAQGIVDRGLGDDLNIWAYARVDTVNEGHLDLLKKAGFNWLCLGIESESEHVREGMKKRFTREQVVDSVKKIEAAGIKVLGNYVYGLPDDDMQSMRATLDLAKELNTSWYNAYAIAAYPGTQIYNWARQQGYKLPGDKGVEGGWTAYSHHSYDFLPLPTKHLTPEEVLKFRDDAFHEYVGNPKYLQLVKKEFGQQAVEHLQELNKHRIPRRILGDPRN